MKKIPFVSFHRATPEDCLILFEWRNDPLVRKNSVSSNPVGWQEHETWFRTKLCDSQVAFYILLVEGKGPIGQVRVDLNGSEGFVSITVAPEVRGCGYGLGGLKAVVDYMVQEKQVFKLRALVQQDNMPSQRVFLQNSFVCKGKRLIDGRCFFEFELFLKKKSYKQKFF